METIEDRIDELKHIGAGDEQCQDCLEMSIEPMSVCRRCIADTPEFSRVVRQIMEIKTPSNALAQADAACGVSPGAMGSAAIYGDKK